MPGVHMHKQRKLRGVDDELWDSFGEAADDVGSDRSALIRQFMRWFVGDSDDLPSRPEQTR